MGSSLTIENPDGLTKDIDALSRVASESVLRQATVAGARVILEEVKLRVPVGGVSWEGVKQSRYPGMLRDSMLIAYDKERSAEGLRAAYLITWSKDAFYGRFVEYGTSKMAATPFLRPGYDASKDAAAAKFSDVIYLKVKEFTGE